jgi:single-stranded-DNA-specific exonuclease
MIWQERLADEGIISQLSTDLSVSFFLAKLLAARGFSNHAEAESFLRPKLAHLQDPFDIANMQRAVSKIIKSIDEQQAILLVGDYDVDGISSVAIVQQIISKLGGNVSFVIPRRKDEGYGLSKAVLSRGLKNKKYSLVIALDCGTNSKEEADFLENQKIDLIVVDHHQSKGDLSSFPIFLNPHLGKDYEVPWLNLCTTGLAFKLSHALVKALRNEGNEIALKISMKEFLPLSALGTLADLVPLKNENRILAKFGLKHLGNNPSPGIEAIFEESKIIKTTNLESEDVTFKIAPMINACGRLDDPGVATSLLLENDPQKCKLLARKMSTYNSERRAIEAMLTDEAVKLAEDEFCEEPAIVACGKGKFWNPGVVGIVAGKLANSMRKPCLVLAKTEEDEYRGSGRGAKGINLVNALAECEENLEHWGGHPVAVGLTVKKGQLKNFKKSFLRAIKKQAELNDLVQYLKIDAFVELKDINNTLLEEINQLSPFGQGNHEPILAIQKIKLAEKPRKVGSGEHFQFGIKSMGQIISGIAWRMADNIPPTDQEIDVAFRLRWNTWNQRRSLQMVLVEWKLHIKTRK